MIADQKGILLPAKFGYAYPLNSPKRKIGDDRRYLVQTETAIIGNFDFSVYFTMGWLCDVKQLWRHLSLEDRLKNRDQWIQEKATNYFQDPPLEKISDSWKVIS